MKKVQGYVLAQCVFPLMLLLSGCAGMSNGGGVSIDELRTKANQGDTNAQFLLGATYDRGQRTTKGQSEAAAWYRKAAEQGHAAAQNSLGSMYQYGEGVPQDNTEAVLWYQKAAEQGYAEAYTNLGYMYDGGLGVKQDKQKAVKLYHSGAEKGSLTAMLNIGVSYWKGEGVSKDIVQAYKWLDLARFYTQRSPNMQLKWRVRGVLDEVKKEMTEEQISKAKQLTQEWDAAHQLK
ncbi:MAG: sel1 repeat family protein [Gammaproteobacteria bacterium]|nr:sel1 repeat family protein [Gammaproteobacteria bacterium]